ncbi:replication protein A 14 kDa subunit [Leucoraja erinacea]|uniref:replication protein A 14 kDa subunit n=1 Tax=Leucoraja erinaceus TaxID=7782 RepID=UPI002453A456|nr:replication protein A 14 kDa subunit [Leucoraja erinacea]
MADVVDVPRTRVSAGLVPEFQGRAVCLVGRVHKIHPTGTSFILTDGDGKNVTVEMTHPLDEELSGVVEVVGKVTQKATIKAAYYTPFREDKNSFDLELYHEAVCILHEFSQYYPFGITGDS